MFVPGVLLIHPPAPCQTIPGEQIHGRFLIEMIVCFPVMVTFAVDFGAFQGSIAGAQALQ